MWTSSNQPLLDTDIINQALKLRPTWALQFWPWLVKCFQSMEVNIHSRLKYRPNFNSLQVGMKIGLKLFKLVLISSCVFCLKLSKLVWIWSYWLFIGPITSFMVYMAQVFNIWKKSQIIPFWRFWRDNQNKTVLNLSDHKVKKKKMIQNFK